MTIRASELVAYHVNKLSAPGSLFASAPLHGNLNKSESQYANGGTQGRRGGGWLVVARDQGGS